MAFGRIVGHAVAAALHKNPSIFSQVDVDVVPGRIRVMLLNTEAEAERAAARIRSVDVEELSPDDVKFLEFLAQAVLLDV